MLPAADGFEVVFDQEVQCEVRSGNNESDPHGSGAAPQPLQIRVLLLGDPALPDRVRVSRGSWQLATFSRAQIPWLQLAQLKAAKESANSFRHKIWLQVPL